MSPQAAFGPAASLMLRKGSKRPPLNRLQAFRIGRADPGAGVRNDDVRRPSVPAIGQTRPAVRIGRGQRMVSQRRGSVAHGTNPKATAGREPRAGAPHDDHRKPAGRAVWRPHYTNYGSRLTKPPVVLDFLKLAQNLARAGAHVRFAFAQGARRPSGSTRGEAQVLGRLKMFHALGFQRRCGGIEHARLPLEGRHARPSLRWSSGWG